LRTILRDHSEERIIPAIEENLAAWLPIFGRLGEYHENNPAGVRRSITDIPFPLLNSIMDARLGQEQVEQVIQAVLADASRLKVPLLWWIGPSTLPADLGKRLEEHGFSLDDRDPGMAVDLTSLRGNVPAVENLEIRLAENDDLQRQWGYAMAAGFEVPPEADFVVTAWQRILKMIDRDSVLVFLGLMNGKPSSTSLLFPAAGVAGIYSVATIPGERRKGIAAALVQHSLLHARSLGYEIGVLESSSRGYNIYSNLGFQQCCTICSYRWRPG